MDKRLVNKIRSNIRKIGEDLREWPGCMDGNYLKDREKKIKLNHIYTWTQSFFTGMALWAYKDTGDKEFLDWCTQFKDSYRDKVFKTHMDTMHDLGFLYSPYAVMLYEITGDEDYKDMAVRAAEVLAMRFEPVAGYIRAWGRMDDLIPDYIDEKLARDQFFSNSNGLAIVDCMMNIPLMFWASKITGHPFYERVARVHADTTLKYFVREDYSVRHAYRFSEELGIPLWEDNDCGYSVGSHWARGTSWAIYGFAVAYRYTGKKEYLDASLNILHKFMKESGGGIPVWDFRLPDDAEKALDTSAAAVTLCAVIELEKADNSAVLAEYKKSLKSALEEYVIYDEDTMAILREVNGRHAYSSYADYFYIESLMKENADIEVW